MMRRIEDEDEEEEKKIVDELKEIKKKKIELGKKYRESIRVMIGE